MPLTQLTTFQTTKFTKLQSNQAHPSQLTFVHFSQS